MVFLLSNCLVAISISLAISQPADWFCLVHQTLLNQIILEYVCQIVCTVLDYTGQIKSFAAVNVNFVYWI